jgi:hypothetical protein
MLTETYVQRIPRQPDNHWALSAEDRLREIARELQAKVVRLEARLHKMEKRVK